MRKWIPVLIVATALIASATAYPELPERMATHWNFRGEVDGWSSRSWGAWMIPVIIVFIWGLMRWIPTIDPLRDNYVKFAAAFETVMISVMLFMLLVHAMIIGGALGYPIAVGRVMPVAVGLLFVVIGNLLPRARPNWFFGIRTPWTLSSDRVWERSHRFGGRLFVVGGLLVAMSGLVDSRWSFAILTAVVVVCALASVGYSYLEWKKEKETPRPEVGV